MTTNDLAVVHYAALIRPAIDRVYISMRNAAHPRVRRVVEETGLQPGFINSFYYGLLARPMPAAAFAAAEIYVGADMTEELEQGIATVDGQGAWILTPSGTQLALAFERAVGEGAQEHWSRTDIVTMPGAAALPRLADLLGVLLQAGLATGGPAFAALAPVHEPDDASYALKASSRLQALRHHRADAHRAAWTAAGLSLAELRELAADGPQRRAIEEQTNRLDAPIYQALTEQERWEFLAILAALP